MKKLKITSLVFILGLLAFSSCKEDKDPEPSVEKVQLDKLVGTWNNNTVTLDGTIDQGDWNNFTVTFADGTYTSSGASAGRETTVWKSSGNWAFKDAGTTDVNINTLVRGDGVEMAIVVDETSLKMTFNYDEDVHGGRTDGISGNWVFDMSK